MNTKREDFLPYCLPLIEDDDIQAVVDSLKSNWVTKGPKTIEFERVFAEYTGTKHAVAFNSCTAGLHTSLVAEGIEEGDEVITTPMTFVSSANVIIHAGATPVFVDIDPSTMNIDHTGIEKKITSRTKAIIPVHIGGLPCEMNEIKALAEKYNLFILEDAAHAVYARYKNQMVGSIGDATAFSFYATKNLMTGEGGMVTTDNDELADKLRQYSLHGMSRNAWNRYTAKGSWFYEITFPGYKYNMTDIQAALGLTQLAKLEAMQKRRQEIAGIYNEEFAELPELELPAQNSYSRHAWHLYVIRLKLERIAVDRAEFIQLLNEENIGTSVHFIPVHLHPYYRDRYGYKRGDFPMAEAVYDRIISLPLYPRMSSADVRDVINAVSRVIAKVRK